MAVYQAGAALDLDPGVLTPIPFTIPDDGLQRGVLELRLQNAGGGQNTGGAEVVVWRKSGMAVGGQDFEIGRFSAVGGLSFHQSGEFAMGSRSFRVDVMPSGKRLRYEATLTTF